MEEETHEEKENGAGTDPTSGKKPEEEPTQVEEIDFKKEAEELDKKEERTELEKAERSLHFNAERVRQLGGDPSRIVDPMKKDEPEFVTKEDFAQSYAQSVTKSPEELKVLMFHYKNSIVRTGNVREDIDNAYMIAHKGRIRRTIEEMDRIKHPDSPTGGPGRDTKKSTSPKMPQAQEAVLRRRGFAFNSKTGEYEAKFNKVIWDSSTNQWITVKK